MLHLFILQTVNIMSMKLALLLITAFVNCAALFLVFSIILRRFKRIAPRYQHMMWFFVTCFFLLIPLISAMTPSLDLHPSRPPDDGRTSFAMTVMPVPDEHEMLQPVDLQLQDETRGTDNRTDLWIPWYTLFIAVWLCGASTLLVRIFVGKIGVHCIIKHSSVSRDMRSLALLKELSRRLDVRQNVIIRKSEQCLTPFTCSLLHPAIMLPSTPHTWPEKFLKAILLHELAHVKRRDHITRIIARLMCCLFWYIPPIWIVYRRMLMAEEKACDALVVQEGIASAEYADHLMSIIQRTGGKVLRLGMQHAIAHKSTLEERITDILNLKRGFKPFRAGYVLIVAVILFACLFPLLALKPASLGLYGNLGRKDSPEDLLCGRWVNPYYDQWHPLCTCYEGKVVFSPNGTIHFYWKTFTSEYAYIGGNGTYEVTESWTDWQGSYWCTFKAHFPLGPSTFYHLCKIDNSGSIMEIAWNDREYPDKLDRKTIEYSIYYRSR